MPATLFRCVLSLACLAPVLSAQATLPTVTMRFDQPTGTVSGIDPIDVWVTLTIDAAGPALSFDAAAGSPFGLDPADLPAQGHRFDPVTQQDVTVDFASYTYVQTNTAYGCSGDFTSICDPGAYRFDFHLSDEPGKPSLNFKPSLDLQPGGSISYLFGTFTPVGGQAAPGSYSFYSSYAYLEFAGLDADGNTINASTTLGYTCNTGDASCAFTREVTAVPEVQSWALMAAGLAVLTLAGQRRRRPS